MKLYISKPTYVKAWKNREPVSITINGLSISPGNYYVHDLATGIDCQMGYKEFENLYVDPDSIGNVYNNADELKAEIEEADELAELEEIINDS